MGSRGASRHEAHTSLPRASWSPPRRGAGEFGRALGELDARSASTRSRGLVSGDTPRCSSTLLWNQTTSPCDCGGRWDFTSSGPCLRRSSTLRWAVLDFTSCTGASEPGENPKVHEAHHRADMLSVPLLFRLTVEGFGSL